MAGCRGAGDAEALLGGARCVAQDTLEVVEGRDQSERAPDLELVGLPQPVHLLGVEGGTAMADVLEGAVDGAPVQQGYALRGFVLRGLVLRGFVRRGFVLRGFVLRGFVLRGFVVRRFVWRSGRPRVRGSGFREHLVDLFA